MKTAQLLAAAVLMTVGGLTSFASMASAGEGGAAGSVSVIMTGGAITNLSAAAAVGKLNAASATNSAPGGTFASAFGSAGVLTVTSAGTSAVGYADVADAALGTAQANTMSNPAIINATNGTVIIP